MGDFTFYFKLGLDHILSLDALDHLLFLAALRSVYVLRQWKEVLILATAFTIGHCITLALSTYKIVQFNTKWTEFLIPLTILLVSLRTFFGQRAKGTKWFLYLMAAGFGLIHGMGYANYLRFMIPMDSSLAGPLVSFNIGIEVAQVIVVSVLLLISSLAVKTGVRQRQWQLLIATVTGLFALWLCITRFPA